MCSEVVIAARNLAKTYRIFAHPGDRIREAFTLGRMKFHREFTAIRGVSFEVRRGEMVGIIGRNGSGKSTLLQLICGILKPTAGEIKVNGRISALLELGAGFNPEFTGRENVYFQGAVMGFDKAEVEACFDDIIAFADIGEFIGQPVRVYSSGMYVRLAFSVAIHFRPDVLVIDEALAVGDARFQSKCFRRLEALKNAGTTILLVSHSTEQISRLCDRVLLFDRGQLIAAGDAGLVVNQYLDLLFGGQKSAVVDSAVYQDGGAADFAMHHAQEYYHLRPAYNPDEYRWGDRTAVILDFLLRADGADHVAHISSGHEPVVLTLKVLFMREVMCPVFGLIVKSKDGVTLCGVNSAGENAGRNPGKAGELMFVEFSLTPHLAQGDYFISVGVIDGSGEEIVPLDRRYDSIHLRVAGGAGQFGIVDMTPSISMLGATYLQGTGREEKLQ